MRGSKKSHVQDVLNHPQFGQLAEFVQAKTDEDRDALAARIVDDFAAAKQEKPKEDDSIVEGRSRVKLKAGVTNIDEYIEYRVDQAALGSAARVAAKKKDELPIHRSAPEGADMPVGYAVQTKEEPVGLTWAQAAGKHETAVHLAKLPPEVRLRENFPEPVRYDAERQLLIYRGFMTAMSYRYLRSFSADLAYIAALDEISVKSSLVEAQPRNGRLWVIGAGIAALVAVAVAAAILWHLR